MSHCDYTNIRVKKSQVQSTFKVQIESFIVAIELLHGESFNVPLLYTWLTVF